MGRSSAVAFCAVLMIGLLPAGTSAAVTRWVDDDGRAGPTSCRGTRSAPRSIQAAINASGRNDTIRVCDGTYVGSVTIVGVARDGLQLRAVNQLRAVIVPAPSTRTQSRRMVRIEATRGVTVRGFDFRPPTSGSCRAQEEVILVRQSRDIRIERNRMIPRGSNTLGRCGFVAGVRLGQSVAVVEDNRITDFKQYGIHAVEGSYELTRNTILFRHDDHRGQEVGAVGIATDLGDIEVSDNSVTGVSTRSLGSSGTPLMSVGIQVEEGGATTVSSNAVRWVGTGVSVLSGAPTVQDNTIVDASFEGLSLRKNDNGGTIEGNRVSGSGDEGIYLHGTGKGIRVIGNDASGNFGVDCRDDTAGGGGTAGTGNTWTGNVGAESSPAALCAP